MLRAIEAVLNPGGRQLGERALILGRLGGRLSCDGTPRTCSACSWLPFPDLSLFRQEYDALGPTKVRRLIDDMKAIEHCLKGGRERTLARRP